MLREMILWPNEDKEGISVGRRNKTTVRFADNAEVFVAKTKVKLQKISYKRVEGSGREAYC